MMPIVFCLTVIGGAGLLALSAWPGAIVDGVFGIPFVLVSVPILGFWFVMLIGLALRDIYNRLRPIPRGLLWGVASALFMFGTMGLLRLHVPERIAFGFYSAELQELTDTAPPVNFRTEQVGLRVGPYRVDRYGTDPRGGVFFRTATGPDGIGPDQMSYGFAFRPNLQGTPFGNAHHRHHHLFGDWYTFSASNDY